MKKNKLKFLIGIICLVGVLESCNSADNSKPFNPPSQKEFGNAWLAQLDIYNNAKTSYEKDKAVETFKESCNYKEFDNWIGQLKEKYTIDDGQAIKLVISQMLGYNKKTDMVYYIYVSKEALAYDLASKIDVNDTIRFSGTLIQELSFTDAGAIEEPEIEVECSSLNGIESFYKEDGSYNNSESTSVHYCAGCNKLYDHNGYYGGPGKGKPYGPLSHQYRSDEYKNYSGGYCSQSCSMKYSK